MNTASPSRSAADPSLLAATGRAAEDWWRGAVIYEIYIRSYQDTTGDGIGDLNGITQRLDYLADLGVDAVWITPFFVSPMKDFGYDVADHRAVDPMFGSLADFDRLVARAHQRGLKIVIDLVLSHTSDQHPWFIESRQEREGPKSDWYVWADAKPDGSPPNNWRSVFGGPAWEWDSGRCQYYLHNFLDSQPDLNFHNVEVQDAALDIARFWLDRGVDGFRLDTVNFYFCDRELRDNPPRPPERLHRIETPAVSPYSFQEHVFDKNRPETLDFLVRFRALLDTYPDRVALGEAGESERGLELIAAYTSGGDKLHMCYSFDFLKPTPLRADDFRQAVEHLATSSPDAWPCWAFSNHDVVRHASRWSEKPDDRLLKLYASILLALPGSVCVYQGEELGLTEGEVGFDDLQDPYGIEFWPAFKGRDGCRTPMVWGAGDPAHGFSSGRPWLPVQADHGASAVDRQAADDRSILAHYRRAIALRQRHPALRTGGVRFLAAAGDVLAFIRTHPDGSLFCAFNLGEAEARLPAPAGRLAVLADSGLGGAVEDGMVVLAAGDGLIASLAE